MERKKEVILIIMAISIVLSLFYLNYRMLYCRPDKAEIGDMFGAVNALFTGLAFAGILITIYIQREDLKLTRRELEGQKAQLKAQNDTLRRQSFENTFFQLLGLHNDIVNAVTFYDIDKKEYKGRQCFEMLYTTLRYEYEDFKKKSEGKEDREIVTIAYESFFDNYQSDIGHYFRNLYHIFKYIHRHDIQIYKKRYTNIVRAQLSTCELALLFYNGLSKYGIERFKPIIEKYQLFDNLNPEFLLDEQHMNMYSLEAFNK